MIDDNSKRTLSSQRNESILHARLQKTSIAEANKMRAVSTLKVAKEEKSPIIGNRFSPIENRSPILNTLNGELSIKRPSNMKTKIIEDLKQLNKTSGNSRLNVNQFIQ